MIYLTTVILLEKEVLKDMNSLEEYNMKKKSIDNGDLSASDDQLPDWVRKSKARRSFSLSNLFHCRALSIEPPNKVHFLTFIHIFGLFFTTQLFTIVTLHFFFSFF